MQCYIIKWIFTSSEDIIGSSFSEGMNSLLDELWSEGIDSFSSAQSKGQDEGSSKSSMSRSISIFLLKDGKNNFSTHWAIRNKY